MAEQEKRRPGLENIQIMDYVRISQKLGRGAEKIFDEYLGEGMRFVVRPRKTCKS